MSGSGSGEGAGPGRLEGHLSDHMVTVTPLDPRMIELIVAQVAAQLRGTAGRSDQAAGPSNPGARASWPRSGHTSSKGSNSRISTG